MEIHKQHPTNTFFPSLPFPSSSSSSLNLKFSHYKGLWQQDSKVLATTTTEENESQLILGERRERTKDVNSSQRLGMATYDL